jgi:hypothetical protein
VGGRKKILFMPTIAITVMKSLIIWKSNQSNKFGLDLIAFYCSKCQFKNQASMTSKNKLKILFVQEKLNAIILQSE